MSIFKVTFMSTPAVPQVYCQLFVAERRDATWALCGNLTMRKGEFDDFQTACPDLEFQNVTPKAALPVNEPADRITVHILHHGWPLCRFTDALPNAWPPGHRWVGLDDKADATCEKCKARE